MAGAGPSPAGGVGGAAREINPSDAALLYQTVVAAQFLEDAQLNGRLADRAYNVEAKKLWQQWHQIVGAKKMSPGELAEFRRANGLDEWTDLGWSMLHRPSPRTAMGGSANDSYKISQLTSALATSWNLFDANNDEHNLMPIATVMVFMRQVSMLLSNLEVDGWRNKDEFLELERHFREIERENENRAVEVADRARLSGLIGRLHDDCLKPRFFE